MTRPSRVVVMAVSRSLISGSVFNFLSEDARAKIEATKKAMIERQKQSDGAPEASPEHVDKPAPPAQPIEEEKDNRKLGDVDVTALRPFARDPNKQDRFDRFVAFAEKGHRGELPPLTSHLRSRISSRSSLRTNLSLFAIARDTYQRIFYSIQKCSHRYSLRTSRRGRQLWKRRSSRRPLQL